MEMVKMEIIQSSVSISVKDLNSEGKINKTLLAVVIPAF